MTIASGRGVGEKVAVAFGLGVGGRSVGVKVGVGRSGVEVGVVRISGGTTGVATGAQAVKRITPSVTNKSDSLFFLIAKNRLRVYKGAGEFRLAFPRLGKPRSGFGERSEPSIWC